MRPRSVVALMAALAAAFAAGVWCAPWLRKPPETGAHVGADAPRPPAKPGGAPAGSLVLDPAQSKADARLVLASPPAFLDSLRGISPLLARARIAAAAAELPLAAVQAMEDKLEWLQQDNHRLSDELLSSLLERWAELDEEGLLQRVRQNPDKNSMNYMGARIVFAKLAGTNPDAAWQRAAELASNGEYARQGIIQTLIDSDPAKALELIASVPETRGEWFAESVLAGWMLRDPAGALKALNALPAGPFRSSQLDNAADSLAMVDPETALEQARTASSASERRTFATSAITAIAGKDPHRALALLDDPEFAGHRRYLLETVISHWGQRDFSAAFDYARALKNPTEQQAALTELSQIETINVAEYPELLEAADVLPTEALLAIYRRALFSAAKGQGLKPGEILARLPDPGLAESLIEDMVGTSANTVPLADQKELFAQLSPSSQTPQLTGQLAERLTEQDAAAAWAWAEGLASPELREEALGKVVSSVAESDPASAAAKASALSDAATRASTFRAIASHWADRDPAEAWAWAQTLSGADQSAALGVLVKSSLETDPARARELYATFAAGLDAEAAAKPENLKVAGQVAGTLAETDPREALAWANGLTSGSAQHQAFATIAAAWARNDALSTSEWIGTLPAGEGRDFAATSLVTAIASHDPDSAWAWATSIRNETKRRAAAAHVLQTWKSRGRTAAARAALQAAGFSDDDSKELAKTLE